MSGTMFAACSGSPHSVICFHVVCTIILLTVLLSVLSVGWGQVPYVHTSVGVYEVSHYGDDHMTSHMMTAIPDQDLQHKTRTEVFIMTAEEELSHWLDNEQCEWEGEEVYSPFLIFSSSM